MPFVLHFSSKSEKTGIICDRRQDVKQRKNAPPGIKPNKAQSLGKVGLYHTKKVLATVISK